MGKHIETLKLSVDLANAIYSVTPDGVIRELGREAVPFDHIAQLIGAGKGDDIQITELPQSAYAVTTTHNGKEYKLSDQRVVVFFFGNLTAKHNYLASALLNAPVAGTVIYAPLHLITDHMDEYVKQYEDTKSSFSNVGIDMDILKAAVETGDIPDLDALLDLPDDVVEAASGNQIVKG